MSVNTPVGERKDWVDTQGFALRVKEPDPSTDTTEYRHVLSLVPAKISHTVDFNQLTDDTVEKLFSLTDAKFEVVMMLDEVLLPSLLQLTLPVNAQITTRQWTVIMTSDDGGTAQIQGQAAVSDLNVLDAGVGYATVEFALDFVSAAAVSPTAGVTRIL